jgi:hypothetical protein
MALAHDAGERVLWKLLRDIDSERRDKGILREALPISILAESLGNRVAVTLIDKLSEQFSSAENTRSTPLLRYILAHPALRNIDLANQKPTLRLPQSPLQEEMRAINGSEGPEDDQTALMFYSPFDKAGLMFHSAQNSELQTRNPFPEAYMLGRSGLGSTLEDGDITQPSGYRRNENEKPLVRVQAIHANRGNDYEDLWHVTLFGWVLPGMQSVSRPIYEWNQSGWVGTRTVSVLEQSDNVQITTQRHLAPIWRAMGNYVRSGATPLHVSYESEETQ